MLTAGHAKNPIAAYDRAVRATAAAPQSGAKALFAATHRARRAPSNPCATTAFREYRVATSAAMLTAGYAEEAVVTHARAVRTTAAATESGTVACFAATHRARRASSKGPHRLHRPPSTSSRGLRLHATPIKLQIPPNSGH